MKTETDLGTGDNILRGKDIKQYLSGECPHCKQDIKVLANNTIIDYQSYCEELEERLKEAISHNGRLFREIRTLDNIIVKIKELINGK